MTKQEEVKKILEITCHKVALSESHRVLEIMDNKEKLLEDLSGRICQLFPPSVEQGEIREQIATMEESREEIAKTIWKVVWGKYLYKGYKWESNIDADMERSVAYGITDSILSLLQPYMESWAKANGYVKLVNWLKEECYCGDARESHVGSTGKCMICSWNPVVPKEPCKEFKGVK